MSLPTHVQVGSCRFQVICDEAEINKAQVDERAGLRGLADRLNQRLLLNPQLGPDQMAETLLHETLHAVMWQTGLADRLDDREEDVVTVLAPALVDLLRRNQPLVLFLLEGSHVDA